MPLTPWPDYAPANQASARTYLEAIVGLCNGWLAVLPPNPQNPYVVKYTAIRDAAWKDLENVAHGQLRQYVVEGTGEPVDGDEANLESAWNHVTACHATVSLPQPALWQLGAALESIEHMGGGGGGAGAPDVEPEAVPPKGWLDFRPKNDRPALAALLDAVEAAAIGVVLRPSSTGAALGACARVLDRTRALRRLASGADAVAKPKQRAAYGAAWRLHVELRRIRLRLKALRACDADVARAAAATKGR